MALIWACIVMCSSNMMPRSRTCLTGWMLVSPMVTGCEPDMIWVPFLVKYSSSVFVVTQLEHICLHPYTDHCCARLDASHCIFHSIRLKEDVDLSVIGVDVVLQTLLADDIPDRCCIHDVQDGSHD